MQIGLFDIQNDVIVPDEVAVRILPWMRQIREKFPNDYLRIYAYLFYMSCWDGRNIYINRVDEEREQAIIEDLHIDFNLDDAVIVVALEKCKKLYETPMVKAFRAAKIQVERISDYLANAIPTDGKFSNIPDINKFMEKLPDHVETYDKLGEKLKQEQSKIRGGKQMAYDQETDYKNLKD